MRWWAVLVLGAGCAAAGQPDPHSIGGGDQDAHVADVPVDACPDSDHDGTCDSVDKCAGHDDRVDSDADTIADGCDKCPGQDDRPDVNMNGTPDCAELMTRTIDVKKVGNNYWRGWYCDAVGHTTANDNTITGLLSTQSYHSYFVFSLAGFTATAISEVKLELEVSNYTSSDSSELMSVWDVTTPSTTIEPDGSAIAIYNDLGGGMQYGTQTLTSASISTTTPAVFMLNAQAASDLKARLGGEFVVGLKLDNPPGYVKFSEGVEPRIARLTVKYLP